MRIPFTLDALVTECIERPHPRESTHTSEPPPFRTEIRIHHSRKWINLQRARGLRVRKSDDVVAQPDNLFEFRSSRDYTSETLLIYFGAS